MSPDASSIQIQFPTYKRIHVVSPQVSSRLRTTISTNPTTKMLTAAGIPVEEEILDAQKAIELIPKLDPPDLLQQLVEYAGIFDEPVKLPLSREMAHQIQLKPSSIPTHQCSYMTSNHHKDEMAKETEETDAVLAKSTLMLGFLTRSGRATKVLQSFATKFQSGLEFLIELSEVDAAENYKIVHLSLLGSRVINKSGEKLFPFMIPWITFELKLVAEKNAAYFRVLFRKATRFFRLS